MAEYSSTTHYPNPHRVVVGQVWKDCDPRTTDRYLRVIGFRESDGRAVCEVGYIKKRGLFKREFVAFNARTGVQLTYIRLDRFKPGAAGFERAEDLS